MKKEAIISLLLVAFTALAPPHAAPKGKRPPAQPPPQRAAEAYDAAEYQRAREILFEGDLPGALEGFCRMVSRPGGEDIWTVSVVLLCDAAEVPKALREIRDPQPVFVVKRVFEGRACFRICAGLTRNKAEAFAMKVRLPEAYKSAGPFPVEVPRLCDSEVPGFQRPKKPSPVPSVAPVQVSDAPAATSPVGPDRPEMVELAPVAATPPQPSKGSVPPEAQSPTSPPPEQQPPASGPGLPPSPPPPPSRNIEAEALFQRGLNAYNLGDRKLAEASYLECLDLAPGKPEALTNLGILYIEQKKYKEARKILDEAVTARPSYARAHLGLAGALWGSEDYREAIEEARRALVFDSHDVSAHLTLASFLRATGQEEDAMKEARLVLLMEPNNQRATEFVNTQPPKKIIKLKDKPAKKKKESKDKDGKGSA